MQMHTGLLLMPLKHMPSLAISFVMSLWQVQQELSTMNVENGAGTHAASDVPKLSIPARI